MIGAQTDRAEAASQPMVSCEGVRFTYDGQRFVLDGIDAAINPGEFACILGGNGSGKSTLAKHMNALLVPDEGRVLTAGMDTADEAFTYDIRSTAGMVFQNPDDQLVASLVEDDVAFGPENLGVPTDDIARRVRDAIAEVGLVGFEKHETYALSGGQKQRVAIAGVLAMEPSVLILDEASSMLDPRGRKGLMRVCKELNARGMTVVMITHFMEEAAESDRVIVLEKGRVADVGAPDAVLVRADELARLNLDVPFSCRLGLALRERGVNVAPHVREADMVAAIAKRAQEAGLLGGASIGSAPEDGEGTAASRSATAAARDAGEGSVTEAAASPEKKAAPNEGPSPADSRHEGATSGDAIIEFEHVSYSYTVSAKERKRRRKEFSRTHGADEPAVKWGNDPAEMWALRDVSLVVREGEFLGIAGHTGSGKSTLIQHMNGLIEPVEGRVLARGRDLADKRVAVEARAHVGVVFQYPERQLFAATVYDDVAFGPRNLGLSESDVDARVRESLSRVGLSFDELREKSPFELSGGQQRRVAFAGVLAMRPQMLVLDEPVAGLDPAARREFLELVAGLHASGLTIAMVSHSMDDLAALCDRIVVMKEGRIFAQGTPDQVFAHPDALKGVGLGLPAAQRMAYALAEAGVTVCCDRLHTLDTLADAVARALGAADQYASDRPDARRAR